MSNANYQIIYKDELYHFRRGGEKNGVRNYQNYDGSLTPLGRIHYGVGPARNSSGKRQDTMGEYFKLKRKKEEDARKEAENKEALARYEADTKSRSGYSPSEYIKANRPEETEAPKSSDKSEQDNIPKFVESSKSGNTNKKEYKAVKDDNPNGEKKEYKAVKDEKKYNDVDENGDTVKDKDGKPISLDTIEKFGKSGSNAAKNASSLVGHMENLAKINYKKGQKSVDLSRISEDEMRATINRLNLERQYREAISTPMDTSGYEKTKEILGIAGDVILFTAAAAGAVKTIKEIRGK